MNIIKDDWTPLFQSLKSKLSPISRKQLLFELIGDLQNIAMLNMGNEGIARPKTWRELSKKYADERKHGNITPTLILKGHLRAGFVHQISEDSASLTNTTEYADAHHFDSVCGSSIEGYCGTAFFRRMISFPTRRITSQ